MIFSYNRFFLTVLFSVFIALLFTFLEPSCAQLIKAGKRPDISMDSGPANKLKKSKPDLKALLMVAGNKFFDDMVTLPIVVFPKSKTEALKNLQPTLKKEFFIKPEIIDVKIKKDKKEKFLFESISFYYKNFLVRGMPVNEASITFEKVEIYKKDLALKQKFTPTKVENVILKLSAPIAEFSEFITEEAKKFGHLIPLIKGEKNMIHIYGPMSFLDFSGDVSVFGAFSVNKSDRSVYFDIGKVFLGENVVPAFIIDTISSMVNPIFMIENLPFKMKPTKVSIENSDKALVIYAENKNLLHKYKKINYKSSYLKKFLK